MIDTPAKDWLIEEESYDPERELYWETVFALSNGYMAARGSLEENHFCPDIRSYFGTYVAGIFDKYHADYQAIVNLPDFFNCVVHIDGDQLDMTSGTVSDYSRRLDMYNGRLVRQFTWRSEAGRETAFEITRFISKADPHLAVQHYRITPLNYSGDIRITNVLDGNVTNIDFHVSGYQLRDEKYYFIAPEYAADELERGARLTVETRTTKHRISEAFKCSVSCNGETVEAETTTDIDERCLTHQTVFNAAEGMTHNVLKTIGVYTTNDDVDDIADAATQKAIGAHESGFPQLLIDHAREWNNAWRIADVRIKGDERDQRNVRFNIYHLIQMGNKDNPRVNIGSRGLTSEMHYGNCFWDTEIFILPFFIYTDPAVARALCQYRHETIDEARHKADYQQLRGAMYPWMSSYPGKEQADYWEYANIAVHIVADVAYGLMHYFDVTRDEKFMLEYGLEIMIETARFWASRMDYNDGKKAYTMALVKGPNEYGIVANNTYTNWNARENLRQAVRMVNWASTEHPERMNTLADQLGLKLSERGIWENIADNTYIHYDAERDLYVEDDSILGKKPVDLKSLKPGKKITTEMGHPWDMLLRLKIVKQADVLLLMFLHREEFTHQQLQSAWDFYEPITLHDSSLSYNTHSIIANELGMKEKSMEYFQQSARLDLEDVMENTFLGIHSANAGGTWQCVINGFGGMRRHGDRLEFSPSLPDSWDELEFKICFRGNVFQIRMTCDTVDISALDESGMSHRIEGNAIICGQEVKEKVLP